MPCDLRQMSVPSGPQISRILFPWFFGAYLFPESMPHPEQGKIRQDLDTQLGVVGARRQTQGLSF